MKIALLGAESTGKSQLAQQLRQYILDTGKSTYLVPEYLRTWCEEAKRTPHKDEQLSIAAEQIRQIHAAAAYDFLLADTTALTIAVYSDLLFNDASLYRIAIANQRTFDLTLVMGLDLPWVADGIQRDGLHMREPVDSALRMALAREGIAFQVVYGEGKSRLQNALYCLGLVTEKVEQSAEQRSPRMRNWVCERCSDPVCEHRLFRDLLKK